MLAVPVADAKKVQKAYFFADSDGVIDYAAPQAVTVAGDRLRIETAVAPGAAPPTGTLSGVLRLEYENEDGSPRIVGLAINALPGSVPAAGARTCQATGRSRRRPTCR